MKNLVFCKVCHRVHPSRNEGLSVFCLDLGSLFLGEEWHYMRIDLGDDEMVDVEHL
jgi:hypothetical protein